MKKPSSDPKSPADTSRTQAAREWSRQNDEQRSTRAATQDPEVEKAEQQRTGQSGEGGLGNENRPGLGTRTAHTDQPLSRGRPVDVKRQASDQGQTTKRPEPREQRSDSLEQEQQRSTGMSGMSSGT